MASRALRSNSHSKVTWPHNTLLDNWLPLSASPGSVSAAGATRVPDSLLLRFTADQTTPAAPIPARVSSFEVRKPYSHWRIQVASQSILPAYRGSVWIDPGNARVLRIEMQARSLPSQFPLDTVESAVDYQYLRIGAGEFLLPVHAETLGCQRGSNNCSRNTIDFRNYHKYDAQSSITFDTATTNKP